MFSPSGLHSWTHLNHPYSTNPVLWTSTISDIWCYSLIDLLLKLKQVRKLCPIKYGEAIAILKRRFSSRKDIMTRHTDSFLTLMPSHALTTSNVSGSSMTYWSHKSEFELKSLRASTGSYDNLLSSVLMSKLPPGI